MKNIFNLFLIYFFIITPIFSQSRYAIAIRAGTGFSNIVGSDAQIFDFQNKIAFSLYLNLVANVLTGDHFEYLILDLGLDFRGAQYQDIEYFSGKRTPFVTKHFNRKYFNTSLGIKFKFQSDGSTPFLYAGLYQGILISGEDPYKLYLNVDSPTLTPNGYDYGVSFGIGYDIGEPIKAYKQRQIGIELRYSRGIPKTYFANYGFEPEMWNESVMLHIRYYLIYL